MFSKGDIINGIYQIVSEIGRGGIGVIYLAYHLHLRKYVVLKRIQTGVRNIVAIRTEVDILKNLHHTNLPQVYDFIVNGDDVFTVMEYIQGRDLTKIPCGAANIPEKTLVTWLRQMAEILVVLEKNDPPIVHNDIKPGNIILRPDGTLCLIDFNISIAGDHEHGVIGYSAAYASPEQILLADTVRQKQTMSYTLDVRSDIYSVGATFFYLMTGMVPNGDRHQPVPILKKIPRLGYSLGLCSIIDKCTVWNRKGRYQSAEKLLKAIDHLSRQNSAYRHYVFVRSASWVLSAMLIAGGIYCVLHGMEKKTIDNYQSDYRMLERYMERGDSEKAEDQALSILNDSDYKHFLNESSEERAQLLHLIGDLRYEKENYADAQNYYEQAISVLDKDYENIGVFYRDYALSLIDNGNIDRAEAVLDEMSGFMDQQAFVYQVKAAAAAKREDEAACEEAVNNLLSLSEARDDEKADACLRIAILKENEGKTDEALSWLNIAENYSDSNVLKQRMAALYMNIASQAQDYRTQKKYAYMAKKYYDELVSVPYASRTDKINAAICYSILEDYEKSNELLLDCYMENSSDYLVCAYLAFNYDTYSDRSKVKKYCDEATALVKRMSDQERQSADQNVIEKLSELEGRIPQ